MIRISILLFLLQYSNGSSQWQPVVTGIEYLCLIDSSYQKAKYYSSGSIEEKPLLVALHPWSSDYTYQNSANYSSYCIANDWVFIHPDFRGPNNNPDAAGSEKAIQDILDAVKYCVNKNNIDPNRIYLAGASGGGHAALLTAAKHPDIWAAVSAWVPITDLVAWYEQTKEMNLRYWQDIYNFCGGDPFLDSLAKEEAIKRSSINFLYNTGGINIDINAGIQDGHNGYSVPVSHSLLAFNEIANPDDKLSAEAINYFVINKAVPPGLINEKEDDTLYGEKKVIFRRKSNNARVTIFNGIHEIIYNAACEWLSSQTKNKLTEVKKENDLSPLDFKLLQNYPNPFNPITKIKFTIPLHPLLTKERDGVRLITLKVYDILGNEIATLINEEKPAGEYEVKFDGTGLSSGIYFYTLLAGEFKQTRKMIILK